MMGRFNFLKLNIVELINYYWDTIWGLSFHLSDMCLIFRKSLISLKDKYDEEPLHLYLRQAARIQLTLKVL